MPLGSEQVYHDSQAVEKDMSHVLDVEIQAFERKKQELTERYNGKYVVIKGDDLAGVFDSFNNAAKMAVETLKSPYLIRQVGASESMSLPASVAFRPVYAAA